MLSLLNEYEGDVRICKLVIERVVDSDEIYKMENFIWLFIRNRATYDSISYGKQGVFILALNSFVA